VAGIVDFIEQEVLTSLRVQSKAFVESSNDEPKERQAPEKPGPLEANLGEGG
jgi:hypothetical protein